MNILLVDDEEQIKETWNEFSTTVGKKIWESNNIKLSVCTTLDAALKSIKEKKIDFLIVDLRLGSEEPNGNALIKNLSDLYLRIPTIVVTATPDDVEDDGKILRKFKKGEDDDIGKIVNYMLSVYKTGINEIIGRTGLIESLILQIYEKSLLPSIDKWRSYGEKNPEDTKTALLRYTINHLYEALDEGTEKYYPEEMYIKSISENKLATGSLLKKDEINYVVLSPACDLVIRKDGDFKTDSVLLVKIESLGEIITPSLAEIQKPKKKNDKLVKFFTNTETLYYHWLPKTFLFEGGIINFRKIYSITKEELLDYEFCNIQISPYFIKDIIARFSSYYARQGQPDINNEEYLFKEQ